MMIIQLEIKIMKNPTPKEHELGSKTKFHSYPLASRRMKSLFKHSLHFIVYFIY